MNEPVSDPTAPHGGHHSGQFGLLRQRRFGPFFLTQFLGAANDNLFKFAFTVLVTYHLQVSWLPANMAGLVIGGLIPLVVAEVYERLRGVEGLGMGDVKMLALIGAFLGWRHVLLTLVVAFVRQNDRTA